MASAVVVSHLPSGGGCISFSLGPSQDSFSHVPLLASPGVAHKHWCISQGTCSDWRPGRGRRQLHSLYQVPNNASPEPSEAVGLAWSRSAFDQRWQHAPFPRGCRRGRRASPDPQSSVTLATWSILSSFHPDWSQGLAAPEGLFNNQLSANSLTGLVSWLRHRRQSLSMGARPSHAHLSSEVLGQWPAGF